MTLFTNIWAVIILSVICVLHFVGFVLSGIYGKIAVFVNIALHISLLFPLLILGAKMQDVTLAYMISVFVYVLFALIFYKVRRKEDDV